MSERTRATLPVIRSYHLPEFRPHIWSFRPFTRSNGVKPGSRSAQRLSTARFLALFPAAFIVMFAATWAYVAEMPMAFLNLDYAVWTAKRAMLDNCQMGSVAVFGDSRALASTMPSVMSIPVKNFAMGATSPIETYFAVARALQCPKPPKLVIISHVPLIFTSDGDYWNVGAKLGLFGYGDMRLVDTDAARLRDHEIENLWHRGQLPPALRSLLFSWRFPPFYFDSLTHGFIAGRWKLNRAGLRDMSLSSGYGPIGNAPGSSEVGPEAHAPTFKPSPLIDLYFSRTLELLQKRGVPTIFLPMPVNHATHAQVRPEFRDQFGAYLHGKAARYSILRVVGPAIPCWPDQFFGDVAHLNARGAEIYSRTLDPWLRRALANRMPDDLPDRCAAAQ